MNSEKKVFISYAREDVEAAKRIYTRIKNAGGMPWMDQEDLLPGQDWEMEIARSIRNCSHFIAIISKNSVDKRGFVQKEIRKALDVLEELPPGTIYIIPVRLDNVEPLYSAFGKIHRVDMFPSWEDSLRKILMSLGLHPESGISNPNGKSDKFFIAELSRQEVLSKVKEAAARDHPNDFSTQKYIINKQLESWDKLKRYKPTGVPEDVVNPIMEAAWKDHPFDFSVQLYIVEKQVAAWKDLNYM